LRVVPAEKAIDDINLLAGLKVTVSGQVEAMGLIRTVCPNFGDNALGHEHGQRPHRGPHDLDDTSSGTNRCPIIDGVIELDEQVAREQTFNTRPKPTPALAQYANLG
jgi:hypothetical protein